MSLCLLFDFISCDNGCWWNVWVIFNKRRYPKRITLEHSGNCLLSASPSPLMSMLRLASNWLLRLTAVINCSFSGIAFQLANPFSVLHCPPPFFVFIICLLRHVFKRCGLDAKNLNEKSAATTSSLFEYTGREMFDLRFADNYTSNCIFGDTLTICSRITLKICDNVSTTKVFKKIRKANCVQTLYLWCQYKNICSKETILDFNVQNQILYSNSSVSSIIDIQTLLIIN